MTTYYVKTFECIFPFNWGQEGDSINGMLTAYLNGSDPYIKTKEDHTLKFQDQQIFYLAASSATPSSPPANTGTLYIALQSLPGKYMVWDDKRLDGYLGFSGIGWASGGKNWTSPDSNFAVWQQELVDYIETAKAGNADWGVDSGGINIYIFKYKYNNQPTVSAYGYFVFIFKGNDFTRDLELTPS